MTTKKKQESQDSSTEDRFKKLGDLPPPMTAQQFKRIYLKEVAAARTIKGRIFNFARTYSSVGAVVAFPFVIGMIIIWYISYHGEVRNPASYIYGDALLGYLSVTMISLWFLFATLRASGSAFRLLPLAFNSSTSLSLRLLEDQTAIQLYYLLAETVRCGSYSASVQLREAVEAYHDDSSSKSDYANLIPISGIYRKIESIRYLNNITSIIADHIAYSDFIEES